MITTGVYNQIVDKAIKMSTGKFHDGALYQGSNATPINILEFIADTDKQLNEKGIDKGTSEYNAATAGVCALSKIYYRCVQDEIENSVNNIFANESSWLSDNGVAAEDKENIVKYAKAKIAEKNKLDKINGFSDNLDNLVKNAKSVGEKAKLIQETFLYAEGVNKALLNGKSAANAITKPDMKYILPANLKVNLMNAVTNCTFFIDRLPKENENDNGDNNHPGPGSLEESFLNNDPLNKAGVYVPIRYDAQESISPRGFLERFENNALTNEDIAWGNEIYNKMVEGFIGKVAGNSKANSDVVRNNRIGVTDFMVGVEQIVSKADYEAARDTDYKNENEQIRNENTEHHFSKQSELNCKVVASLLRGDKVFALSNDENNKGTIMYFNPTIKPSNEKKGLMGIIDSILEFFASILHISTDKSFDKAMNEVFANNDKEINGKNQVTFNELEDEDRTATNRARPRNTNAVEDELDDSIVPITHTK